METVTQIASAIMELPERSRSGTLRMFGDWFGRPMDNVHRVTGAHADGETLVLKFNNAEKLSVWNPAGFSTSGYTIRVADADRVRWEWFYYGRDQNDENLLYYDYQKQNGNIVVTRTHGSDNPGPSVNEPAVELIGL